jgi:hypothetical protein
MHTIHLQIEDNIYNELINKGVNVQDELKTALHKILYKKEYKIASEIKEAKDEVAVGKTRPIQNLLNEF